MRQLQGKIEGPFSVEEDSALHGMITVGATVRKGVVFHVHGMITGDLTVESDGVGQGASFTVRLARFDEACHVDVSEFPARS